MAGTLERSLGFVGLLCAATLGWLVSVPLPTGGYDAALLFAGLQLAGAVAVALIVTKLELPRLAVGWGIFTFGQLFAFLGELTNGPATLIPILPGTLSTVGLAVTALGMLRAKARLRGDITARYERLQALYRLLRHNVENTLSDVTEALEHFAEHADDDDEVHIAARSLAATSDLSTLVEKTGDIDEILGTVEGAQRRTFDLAPLVSEVADDVGEAYPKVDISVEAPGSTAVTAIDGIDVAVRHVLENACEHADSGDPVVEVSIDSDHPAVTLSVADNGPSIAPNKLESIRGSDVSELDQSSGVGLWFVHWLVAESNGKLEFQYEDGQTVRMQFQTAGPPGDFGLAGVQ
jgi:signal transduction histidine kinase